MITLNYVVWDPSPVMFFLGSWEMRWYGFLFALGFLFSQQILFYIFREEGKPEKDVESLTFFIAFATILGARLGHVLIYEPEKYLAKPVEILKVWEGGLASHGAAIGILLAIYLYSNYLIRIDFGKLEVKKRKRPGQNYMWVVDRLVIVVALTGSLIRLGNFINSEIVGLETKSDYGVVFARDTEEVLLSYGQGKVEKVEAKKLKPGMRESEAAHPVQLEVTFTTGVGERTAEIILENIYQPLFQQDSRIRKDLTLPKGKLHYELEQDRGVLTATILAEGIPRHPAQLYESLSSFLIFLCLFFLWSRRKGKTAPGRIFGIFLIVLFGLRFIYEFFKENQVEFEDELYLNMGQILSIPMVFAGILILVNSFRNKTGKQRKEDEFMIKH